jgi:hypothetical protein
MRWTKMEVAYQITPLVIGMLLIGIIVVIDMTTRRPRRASPGDAFPLYHVDLEGLLSLQHAISPRPETGCWRNVWIRIPSQNGTGAPDAFSLTNAEYSEPSSTW